MSSIYKIQFLTTMYIYALNDDDARDIGRDYLIDEISNGSYEEFDLQKLSLTDAVNLDDEALRSIPWKRSDDQGAQDDRTVGEILCLVNNKMN